MYDHLFDRGAKVIPRRHDALFNKCVGKLDLGMQIHAKNAKSAHNGSDLNLRSKTIKLLDKNQGNTL